MPLRNLFMLSAEDTRARLAIFANISFGSPDASLNCSSHRSESFRSRLSQSERTRSAHSTSLAAFVLRRLLFNRAMTTARFCLRGLAGAAGASAAPASLLPIFFPALRLAQRGG